MKVYIHLYTDHLTYFNIFVQAKGTKGYFFNLKSNLKWPYLKTCTYVMCPRPLYLGHL